MAKTIRLKASEKKQIRDEWVQKVLALEEQVAEWAKKQDWKIVPRPEKEIQEGSTGTYSVPVLEIVAPNGDNLILEPIAREAIRFDRDIESFGGVDLYVYPTLSRVRLRFNPTINNWIVRTDSALDWPNPWNEETFKQIATGLLDIV